ncbi:VOC family protein [Alteromonas sp. D210916BOD_24]|uniref:SMU1112c/YaeR family gloxylase I-like metalloprotein n=1 Tax=Alteromonas sp. D210916BOD_24 TaxID=3157618 RepID=UPI00399C9C88
MLKGFHHVAIICSDYPRSKAFYTDVLGFNVLDENYRKERSSYKCDLSLDDGSQIELFSFPDAPPRPTRPEAQGLRHLAFKVDNIENAVEALKLKGVVCEPVRTDPYTQKRFTFFQDPDGLPLELYQV